MTIVIHDAAIVTVDDADTVHYNAAIAIEGDRIAAIGPSPEVLASYPDAEKIDGRGKLVMPGFANIHTHFTMTLARGVFEDLSPPHKPPFSGGLSPIPLPDISPDERRAFALLGALEALRSGTRISSRIPTTSITMPARWPIPACASCWQRGPTTASGPRSAIPRRISSTGAGPDATSGTSSAIIATGTARPTAACASRSQPGRPTCARPSCCRT